MAERRGDLYRGLREHLLLVFKRLQGILGSTVVYVTHDQDEALVMSDRIAVMNQGIVEQCAPPEMLYVRPASRFVATFVGDSNVLSGRVIGSSGADVHLETDAGDRIRGTSDRVVSADERAVATVRPERITVHTDARPSDGLTGTCVSHVYAGESSRYEIETSSGIVMIRRQNRPDAAGIALGATVHLTWEPGDLRVFPAGADHPHDLARTGDRTA
jgi:ABC-type Fe3+/spermidine/putrescine transport system ATPase subunit